MREALSNLAQFALGGAPFGSVGAQALNRPATGMPLSSPSQNSVPSAQRHSPSTAVSLAPIQPSTTLAASQSFSAAESIRTRAMPIELQVLAAAANIVRVGQTA
jgi:hypothetical protein